MLCNDTNPYAYPPKSKHLRSKFLFWRLYKMHNLKFDLYHIIILDVSSVRIYAPFV